MFLYDLIWIGVILDKFIMLINYFFYWEFSYIKVFIILYIMFNFKNLGVLDFMCVNKVDKWILFFDCFIGLFVYENNNYVEIKLFVLMFWFKLKRIFCENEWIFFFICRLMVF